jgi:hypothetical protein
MDDKFVELPGSELHIVILSQRKVICCAGMVSAIFKTGQ